MNRTRIKSTAINGVAYTGLVTLSRYANGKRAIITEAHNAGGRALFNFLANCLLGEFDTANSNRPAKILLMKKDADELMPASGQVQFEYMSTNPELVQSSDECAVRYSFIIPQDRFKGTAFNAIGLYTHAATTADLLDYIALCEIDSSVFTLSNSSVLVLDWELHISNITQQQ